MSVSQWFNISVHTTQATSWSVLLVTPETLCSLVFCSSVVLSGLSMMASDGNGGATKRKAPDEVEVDYLELSIRGQDGSLLFYKVNSDKQFTNVFRNYCDRKELQYESTRFLYKGLRVLAKQKPKKLNLENGDELLAVGEVSGGGVAALN